MWQVPHGDTPDDVRNHPALQGHEHPEDRPARTSGVGLMVTKTLVVMGDPQVTTTPEHPRGAMLRAYDKTDRRRKSARCWMPAPQSGSPMTYIGRRQAVHRRRGQRRQLLGRVHRVHPPGHRRELIALWADLKVRGY